MFEKFFEAQQSSEALKLICAEVIKIKKDLASYKERQIFENLDLQNQNDIYKFIDLKRADTVEYQ